MLSPVRPPYAQGEKLTCLQDRLIHVYLVRHVVSEDVHLTLAGPTPGGLWLTCHTLLLVQVLLGGGGGGGGGWWWLARGVGMAQVHSQEGGCIGAGAIAGGQVCTGHMRDQPQGAWGGGGGFLYRSHMCSMPQHEGGPCLQVPVAPLIWLGSLGLCRDCLTLQAELLHAAPQLVDYTVPLLQRHNHLLLLLHTTHSHGMLCADMQTNIAFLPSD